jgi:hypothetical protein
LETLSDQLDSVYTGTPPTVVQIRQEMDSNSADFNTIIGYTDDIGVAGIGLTAIPWNVAWDAEVQSEAEEALTTYHLDHLLETNTASLPGSAGSILQDLLEDDGGTWRYTANALEQAPSGSVSAPSLLLDTTVATVDSQTQITLTAGSDQDDAYSSAIVVLEDASNSDFPSIRTVTGYMGSTKTLVIDAAPGFKSDMIAGDGVKIFIAERVLDQAGALDTKTVRQALRYVAAILAGETSGAGSGTEVFKGIDGLTDRVQVIIDANGDRTTVTYDP